MYPHSPLWHYLWIAPHVIQIAVAIVLLKRGLQREFPWFFAYTVYTAVASGVLFGLDHSDRVSVYVYWGAAYFGTVSSIALRFGVIYELYTHIFGRYRTLRPLHGTLLKWSAALLLLVAAGFSAYAPGHDPRLFAILLTLNRGVALMQSGLLLILFALSAYFHLSWKSYTFGLAAGLGIFAAVELSTSVIRVAIGPRPGNYVLDFITMATYHLCVLIWLAYLLLPEAVGRPIDKLPPHNLEDWNEELHRLLTP